MKYPNDCVKGFLIKEQTVVFAAKELIIVGQILRLPPPDEHLIYPRLDIISESF